MIHFISDTHFGHTNIIKYDKLPFANVGEMDDAIIKDWNNVVEPDDTVYMLGDFTLRDIDAATSYMYRLSGQIKILGNPWHHDRYWLSEWSSDVPHVEVLPPVVVLDFPEHSFDGRYPRGLVLCHYPFARWDRKHHWSWHIHGHVHDEYTPGELSMNVGASELFRRFGSFDPVSLEFLAVRMLIEERKMLKRGVTMP